MQTFDSRRFPIGKFIMPQKLDMTQVDNWIDQIHELPDKLSVLLLHLNEDNLTNRYRKDSWTIRQVIHHIADSHMNAYIRCKLAKTEDGTEIKPYDEKQWAEEEDSLALDPKISVDLLKLLHTRWVIFLRSLTAEELNRKAYHPESKRSFTIYQFIALYAWHGNHHLAHVKLALTS